jgi:hypothetical protein
MDGKFQKDGKHCSLSSDSIINTIKQESQKNQFVVTVLLLKRFALGEGLKGLLVAVRLPTLISLIIEKRGKDKVLSVAELKMIKGVKATRPTEK